MHLGTVSGRGQPLPWSGPVLWCCPLSLQLSQIVALRRSDHLLLSFSLLLLLSVQLSSSFFLPLPSQPRFTLSLFLSFALLLSLSLAEIILHLQPVGEDDKCAHTHTQHRDTQGEKVRDATPNMRPILTTHW